jgi:orotate phosphoribosyltransferase
MEIITKNSLMRDIIEKNIFVVSSSPDEQNWIPLKNGSRTPLFLDTSKFSSFPDLNDKLNKYVVNIIKEKNILFNEIIGIPYGGLSFSYGVSNIMKVPCLSIRKEGKKNYSTAGELLGVYNKEDVVLLMEDATVTADTAIQFVKKIREYGLAINDIITVIDVGGNAKVNLQKEGVRLHVLFTWAELYEFFKKEKPDYLTDDIKKLIDKFVYG